MKRTTRSCGWARLAASVLALVLLPAGCARQENSKTMEDSTPSETTGAAVPVNGGKSLLWSGTSLEGAWSGFIPSREPENFAGNRDDAAALAKAEELLGRMGMRMGESVEISSTEAGNMEQAMASMWDAYLAGSDGEESLVKERDWSIYASSLGQEYLSPTEAEFFDRLDKLCLQYLSTSGLDAVGNPDSSGEQNRYRIGGVKYRDLGMSSQEAMDLYTWFAYTSPQYYFLNNWSVWEYSSGIFYPCVYEFAADGEERAEITNELFDKLDGWIEEVESMASTAYRKELYANKLICETACYNYDALESDDSSSPIWICQSLYSTVMLESTVCAGYAKAFCAMMNAMDVDATVGLSTNHAWNVVRLEDGNCYAVDVCWNDTDGNPPYSVEYMNIGQGIMSAENYRKESHTYERPMAGWIPAIAEESYVPTEKDFLQSGMPGDGTGRPAAPTNVVAVAEGEGRVSITWNPVPGAAVYDSCAYTDFTYSEIIEDCLYTSSADEGAYTYWTNLREGATYYFGVRAGRSVNGETVYSDWVNFSYTHTGEARSQGPAAPANVRVAATGEGRVTIDWDPVPGAAVYDSCAYTDSTCSEVMEGCLYTFPAEEGTSFYWTDLREGATYYFGIRAGKTVNGETVYSDWVNFSYTHGETAPERPAAPANVRMMAAEEEGEALQVWDPVPGAEVYDVCAYTDSTYTQIAEGALYTDPAEEGAYTGWTGMRAGTTYYFGVRAGREIDGEMVYSDWVNISYTHENAP